ncbi:MAG: tetratricopeptide repeat protein [Deltaproteobacteria bacterium]|nr:tetratricopeptide repeat protein [Deltaproteobacteria bacterium]
MKLVCWLGISLILFSSPCLAGGKDKYKAAETLWEHNQFYDAAVLYGDAIDFEELSVDELTTSHYNIATFFLLNFSPADTIKAVNEVLKLNPNHVGAYSLRANASDMMGNDKQALADWTKLLEINPNDATVYNDRSYFYSSRGKLDKAIADMEMYLRLKPDSQEQLEALKELKTKRNMQKEDEKMI